ncbi:type II secretion system F family protein [Streptomyces sp. KL118A]|uniref:type II secretion system F family protein n=1 Tax=Streptomyces sp. KL118A TaxID=3045153 RepID=UPI00278C17C4|nr:type II secretion system F family protein [Streptomyces sp. KL118A]
MTTAMWTAATATCAGSATWLIARRDHTTHRLRKLLQPHTPQPPRTPPWHRLITTARVRTHPEWWCLVAGTAVSLLGASVVPLVVGAAGVPLAARARRARDARRDRERRGDAVIALCGELAGEVRAGRQPGEALRLTLREPAQAGAGPGTARSAVLAAARFGGDVPEALRSAAQAPGAEGLLGLAACWRVAVDRGAGLAAGLERLEDALRSERDQRADLRAQLAGARSTAVMLAALPLLGLLMGAALGADPLRVLLHTGPGLACLAAGAVLEGVGAWWALRIVRGAAER